MKLRAVFGFATGWAAIGCCLAQPAPPVLSGLTTLVDTLNRQVTLTYDLAGKAGDSARVQLHVSDDAGRTYLLEVASATGDVGYPVLPGKRKKIVWQYPGRLAALSEYRVKLVAAGGQAPPVRELVAQVDSGRLRSLVKYLSGNRYYRDKNGLRHLTAVKDTIEKSFRRYGLQTDRQEERYDGYPAHNISGRLTGHVDERQTFIVCAHFDSPAGSPGADDNASGVAGILEAARILSKYRFGYSIRLIGFDLEERGGLGSQHYVQKGILPFEQIRGVLNCDMIGYYSAKPRSQSVPEGFDQLFPEVYQRIAADGFRGNFVVSTANANSAALGERFAGSAAAHVPGLKVVSLVTPGNGEITPALAVGDHASFWQGGHPAVHIGDGAGTRNPHTNGPGDVVSNVNIRFMHQVVQALVATVASLAELQPCSVAYGKLSYGLQ